MSIHVYLSRRNLVTLLNKLNRQRDGGYTARTIVKNDTAHPIYPQTDPNIYITAIEDMEYYRDRSPGEMHPEDTPT
jgi:hypothetical protein